MGIRQKPFRIVLSFGIQNSCGKLNSSAPNNSSDWNFFSSSPHRNMDSFNDQIHDISLKPTTTTLPLCDYWLMQLINARLLDSSESLVAFMHYTLVRRGMQLIVKRGGPHIPWRCHTHKVGMYLLSHVYMCKTGQRGLASYAQQSAAATALGKQRAQDCFIWKRR